MNFVWVGILIFLWLRCPSKASEPYTNPFVEKSKEQKRKEKRIREKKREKITPLIAATTLAKLQDSPNYRLALYYTGYRELLVLTMVYFTQVKIAFARKYKALAKHILYFYLGHAIIFVSISLDISTFNRKSFFTVCKRHASLKRKYYLLENLFAVLCKNTK